MGNEFKSRISTPVFFALLLVTLSGTDFLTAPNDAARICGPSGYWAVIVAFLLAVPLIWFLAAFQRRFPRRDLLEAASLALGRPLAFLGNLLFITTFFVWLIVGLRNGTDLIAQYLLNRTPRWVVLLTMLIAMVYPAVHGLTGVSRLAAFVLIPTIALRLGMKLLSLQAINRSHLLPLVSERPLEYLLGGLALVGAYAPLVAILLIHPRLNEPGRLLRPALGAAAGITAMLLIGVIGTIGIFGAEFTQKFLWSNMAAVHRINLPYLVLEQVGLLFLIVWLTSFLVAMSFLLHLVASYLSRLTGAAGLHLPTAAVAVAVLAGALLLPDSTAAHELLRLTRQWAIVPLAGYPLFVYLTALIKGRGGAGDAA